MEICGQPSLPLPANQHVDFVAIDFETATSDPNSACAVGLAFVVGLEVVATTHRLIQPPGNQYAQGNIHVHGIYPEDTEHAPDFLTVWQELHPMLAGKALIAHNARFDMSVIKASLAAYGDPYVQTVRRLQIHRQHRHGPGPGPRPEKFGRLRPVSGGGTFPPPQRRV